MTLAHPHDHEHPHPFQPDHPEPTGYYELLGVALNELLIEKGVYTAEELRRLIEKIESAGVETCGAAIVTRAWTDPDFARALQTDALGTIRSLGIEPGYTEITALFNTPQLHNLVVCTLCSCYPRWLLGRPPAWYKSAAYRARAVREPRAVLAEFGTVVPEAAEVRVHDSTAELRYFVVPLRPAGTAGWSEDQLARLVTRDSMIGVAPALAPAQLALGEGA